MCAQDRDNREGISRRGFMHLMGVGAVGVSMGLDRTGHTSAAKSSERVLLPGEMVQVRLKINGRINSILVEPRWSLLYALREVIGLTGTKIGCDRGECGACTVLIDEMPRYACMTLAVEVEGHSVTTIEGLAHGEDLGPTQQAFLEEDAFQCGYCTPGQIMAVEGLLRKEPHPDMEAIRKGVSGNLCRCGAYTHIFRAAQKASDFKKKQGG